MIFHGGGFFSEKRRGKKIPGLRKIEVRLWGYHSKMSRVRFLIFEIMTTHTQKTKHCLYFFFQFFPDTARLLCEVCLILWRDAGGERTIGIAGVMRCVFEPI